MKHIHRGTQRRATSRLALSASLAVFGLMSAMAAQANDRDSNASCRQETKRVAVWPKGSPKAPGIARFEEREVTVCDGKVVSQRSKDKASHASSGD